MKKTALFLLAIFLSTAAISAQQKADDICGYYFAKDPFSKEGSQVKIYKNSQGKYEGIVCWVENPKKEHFLNYKFLQDFVYDAKKNEYVNGKIHHPGNGKTYKSYLKFDGTRLKVRGYVGVSLFGISMYWPRESKQRTQNRKL